MKYISTRGSDSCDSSMEAILRGISADSGLYVPSNIPFIDSDKLNYLSKLDYENLAIEIIKLYFADLGDDNLKKSIVGAYRNKFEVKLEDNFLELYHGPTLAFKDAALLLLPYLMYYSKEILKINNKTIILTATSGDTGKAALEGFKNIEGIEVIVLYPKDGVSDIQKYQMITQEGTNLKVIGIDGNFDDAQRAAKLIFNDNEVNTIIKNKNLILSSANSINIGRLIPQIVYYFYGYFQKVKNNKIKLGESLNVSVPTGNFGNILAAYYAKLMGLPLDKLICASNTNNVLTDFFNTGIYDSNRQLKLTETPSMDILVSSNLERLLFELSNRNSKAIKKYMNDLNEKSMYKVDENIKEKLQDFYGNYSTDEEVNSRIKEVYSTKGYLMDTHTAVAYDVYQKYVSDTKDNKEYMIISTASPFKFVKSVSKALGNNVNKSDFELLKEFSKKYSIKIPDSIKDLNKRIITNAVECHKDSIKNLVVSFLEE